MKHRLPSVVRLALPAAPLAVALGLLQVSTAAQDRLKTMPGYQQYQKMLQAIPGAVKLGSLGVTWSPDGKSFEYFNDGKRYRFDVSTRTAAEIGIAEAPAGREGRGGGGRGTAGAPERGRQFDSAPSPDGRQKAFYRDRNLWVSDANGASEVAVTTDGSEKDRIKYGTASWVYGEELGQRTAMWWSPDSRRIAYYRFDEKQVPDYHLQVDQTQIQSKDDVEAYPKAGAPNPIVDLFVYDVASKKSTKVDVRNGRPFDNDVVGHYVYRIAWSADGSELLFNRTNRKQNILEFTAANPETGRTRTIVREEWPTGWIENSPSMTFLKDGRRFIWESERNGWRNLYLYDLSGKLIAPLTSHSGFEVGSLLKVDEAAGVIFYTARDGDNYMKMQLHRVGLDGAKDVRLTDTAFNHTVAGCMGTAGGGGGRGGFGALGGGCGISPDNAYFVDIYQTHDTPPATRLVDASGKVVADLAKSDLTKYSQLGFKPAEMFTYTAADGKTKLHGLIQFPSNFDPARKYPSLVSVYGGPASASNTARETFVTPNATAEYRLSYSEPRHPQHVGSRQEASGRRLPETGSSRSGRHVGRREGFVEPAVPGQVSRGHLRNVLRRLFSSDGDPQASRGLRRRLRIVTGHVVGALRLDLHRAIHVDTAGEQGELREGQRDEVREGSQGPAPSVLRHGGQQRPSFEHDAAH